MSADVPHSSQFSCFVRFLPSFRLVEKKPFSLYRFSLAILVVILTRISCQLKTSEPIHTLNILSLKMGDLFLTRKNQHGLTPVVGFFEYIEGVKTIRSINTKTAYFKPVQEGIVGIYFRKNVNQLKSGYWVRFHEVWIEGRQCVIHQNFIKPLPKHKEDYYE